MLPQLNVATYYSQLFWLCVSFGLLYLFFAYFIIPNIRSILKVRHDFLINNANISEQLTKRSRDLESEQRQAFLNSQQEADLLLLNVALDIKKHKTETIGRLELDIHQKIAEAEKKVSQERDALEKEYLNKNSSIIADAIIKKVFSDSVIG